MHNLLDKISSKVLIIVAAVVVVIAVACLVGVLVTGGF